MALPMEVMRLPGNERCFDCSATAEDPWVSLSHGTVICIHCAGIHRSFGVHVSYVRSLKLDALKDEEWQVLLKGGNDSFQAFLQDSQKVPRHVWLALPMETRYHTPAADLYRRRLASVSGPLPEELRPVKPPPPVAVKALEEAPVWKASDRCQLCKTDFWLLVRRHHCRKCGRCICNNCSPAECMRPRPELGLYQPCRHCKVCVPPAARVIAGLS
ncbi:unnamed protein product [Effrenium voratum]|nr:unnamed protein product [Effrenium voratum]